jgi:hypothetical protein
VPIRPLRRGDIPAISSLYEHVSRSGSRTPPLGLAAYFERTCLDYPWFDQELPSLVYEDADGEIVGFLASHVRRLRFDGRVIRLACGGQMVTEPAARNRAVGAFLLAKLLEGPQDVTITDTAGEITRRMWARLGGVTTPVSSMTWTRVFRPWQFGAPRVVGDRARRARRLSALLDAGSRRAVSSLRAAGSEHSGEPLTPSAVVDHLPSIAGHLRVAPAYDEAFVRWLFERLPETRTYGDFRARLVRSGASAAGWYAYYSKPGGLSHVIQIAAQPREIGGVIDHLLADAEKQGSAAIQGRVEATLLEPLARRSSIFRWQGEALIHARDVNLLAALLGDDTMLTRMEGEWWMAHHLEPFRTGGA